MRRFPEAGSVRNKLVAMAVATTFVAMVAAMLSMLAYDLLSFRSSWVDDISTQAELVGSASAAALNFNDAKAASQNLAMLRVRPQIQVGAIYDAKGRRFASYRQPDLAQPEYPEAPGRAGYSIDGGELSVVHPIIENGELLGTVYIRETFPLVDRLKDYSMILALVISFLHIVVGELAPKSLAIRNPEAIGLWSAIPLYGFYWSMYPAIYALNSSANAVLRIAGLSGKGGHDSHYSTEELKLILRTSQPGEKFTRDERNILAQSLDFEQMTVSDLMRPIHEVIALHATKSLDENLQTVLRNRFSRYPYFDETGEDVLGVVHLKDLFFAQQAGKQITSLTPFLRPVETISARTPALELFRRFRDGAPHFALIGEKGKRPVGFITLDNLLGAMVGEIRDEFRLNENDWLKQPDGNLIGKASLPIFSLERILGIDIENEELGLEDVESVGGLIMVRLGDIPKQGQRISFADFDIVVKKMNGPRIVLVKVIPKQEGDLDPDQRD
jgi:CBS domain containing-hemolysin-like protein